MVCEVQIPTCCPVTVNITSCWSQSLSVDMQVTTDYTFNVHLCCVLAADTIYVMCYRSFEMVKAVICQFWYYISMTIHL